MCIFGERRHFHKKRNFVKQNEKEWIMTKQVRSSSLLGRTKIVRSRATCGVTIELVRFFSGYSATFKVAEFFYFQYKKSNPQPVNLFFKGVRFLLYQFFTVFLSFAQKVPTSHEFITNFSKIFARKVVIIV